MNCTMWKYTDPKFNKIEDSNFLTHSFGFDLFIFLFICFTEIVRFRQYPVFRWSLIKEFLHNSGFLELSSEFNAWFKQQILFCR